MAVPIPKGKFEIAVWICLTVFLSAVAVVGALARSEDRPGRKDHIEVICREEKEAAEDAERQYQEMTNRLKKRHEEDKESWERDRRALEEQLDKCPCCPGGCDRELIYKDYLFESQRNFYKKWIRTFCDKRDVEPTDEELEQFLNDRE